MPKTIDEWVDYIQTLHRREIDLGLERVARVYQRLYPNGVDYRIISIAGTNGKGSTAELINSIYTSAGYQVGKFTSPHIVYFNERYTINGLPVADQQLVAAFEQIESTRGDIPLTFFEFGALLAVVLFQKLSVDVAIMEVGLGGRLDAVNILDADVSIVTNVSIDHTDWLGDTVEEIALEKIAIARPDKPCLIGMSIPPGSLLDYCQQNDIDLLIYQHDFTSKLMDDQCWDWSDTQHQLIKLPLPYGQGDCQLINASLAIKAVRLLLALLPVNDEAFYQGLQKATLNGRCQLLQLDPTIVLDVSHNSASVARLAEFVQSLNIKGRLIAVCGMLQDKEIAASLQHLIDIVDEWHVGTISHERGASSMKLNRYLQGLAQSNELQVSSYQYAQITDAFAIAKNKLNSDDCLIVFGSFFVVSDIIKLEI